MNGSPVSLGDPLAASRQLFGSSTAVWAEHHHVLGESSWVSLSGSTSPDYNLALVHGGEVAAEITGALDRIRASGAPAIVMLAGQGLAGAQILADEGWVNIGSMPFMKRDRTDRRPDRAVRELREDDLDAARELASISFGVGAELAARVFSSRVLNRRDSVLSGLFEDGELVSCLLLCRAPGVSTGWALATQPGKRRGGYATRLIAGTSSIDAQQRGESSHLCLASPMAKPLYDVLGFETVEYWQTWSRPRWVLGAA
ncbi:N-acetyltransferase [Actinomycetes bacterium M1A6_2h]